MSTFSQWRLSFAKDKGIRQLTWVCGSEVVLVEEVVQSIKAGLNPTPWNFVPLVAGEDSERAIWAEVDQYPIDNGTRLILIRSAEKLKHWNHLLNFIANRTKNSRTFLVFVSSEATTPRLPQTEEESREGARGALVPHIAAFTGKGHVIEARPFTADTAKHAVAWVQSKVPMREGVAAHLLNRSNGDLRLARDLCSKLAVFEGEPTISTINALVSEQPRESFSDALLALNKKSALLALTRIQVSEYPRIIGLLDSRLDLAGLVHDGLVEHKPQYEIARSAGKQNFLVKDIMPVARHYDPKRRLQIRNVLAMADEQLRNGQHVGVLETIVAFW